MIGLKYTVSYGVTAIKNSFSSRKSLGSQAAGWGRDICTSISCSVAEKRNGSYELKLTYPADGIHAEDVQEAAVILAKPSEKASA